MKNDDVKEKFGMDKLLAMSNDDYSMNMCPLPFNSMYIKSSGKVILCCKTAGENIIVADLIENNLDLKKAWFSEIYIKYRKALKVGNIGAIECANCDVMKKKNVQYVFRNGRLVPW